MKSSVLKFSSMCLIALAGYDSVSASPTYSQSCFETEEQAQTHQSKFQWREIDNSKKIEKDELAQKFEWRDDVELSSLQAILGKPHVSVDKTTHLEIYEWTLMFIGSPSASAIRYEASQGYCLDARMGGTRVITYTYTPEIFDNARGAVTRYDFYM